MKKPLFKYLSVERAEKILTDKTIRFTQSDQFNDAFELIPTLDIDIAKRDLLKQGGNAKSLDQFTLGVASSIFEQYSSVGSLCLSSNFDIPLMWGHYADNYRGVVVGFDPEEGLLADRPNRDDMDSYCDIGPVDYSEDRFRYPSSIKRGPLDFMFHKDESWGYENEWRIVRSLKTLDQIASSDDDIFVSSFNPEAVRCLIFGARASENDINKLSKVLSQEEYRHVGKYVSHLSDDKFEIDIEYFTSYMADEEPSVFSKEEYALRQFRGRMISRGQLFKAMEIIDPSIEFVRINDVIDLHLNRIKPDSLE